MAPDIKLDAGVFLMGALGLLVLPLNWFAGAVAAAVFHELCHLAAVNALGGQVITVIVGVRGAEMEIASMSPGKELVCALAGPAGSFLLAGFHRWLPVLSVCGLIQGLFNLLPLYPMDGGRALFCLLSLFTKEEKVFEIFRVLQWILIVCVVFVSVFGAFVWKLGTMSLISGFAICFAGIRRKIPLQTERRESTIRIPFIMR